MWFTAAILPMAELCSCVSVTKTIRPKKPELFIIWPIREKFAIPWPYMSGLIKVGMICLTGNLRHFI